MTILYYITHGHIDLVHTTSHDDIISNTPFLYPDHLGTLIITDGTTAHNNYTMHINNTKAVYLFREIMGLEQALIQKNVTTVE